MPPAHRIGPDRVDVGEQPQDGPGRPAAQPRDEVRALRVGTGERDLEPRRAQEPGQVLLRGALGAGRVDGVEAQQLLQHLDGFGLHRARKRTGAQVRGARRRAPSATMRALLAALLVLLLAGCGATDDAQDLARDARDRLRDQQEQFERTIDEQRDRLRDSVDEVRARIEAVLGDLERAVPRAERTDPEVRAQGRTEPGTIEAYLTQVLQNVDRYWTRTFLANDLPEPRVAYAWVPAGRVLQTGCGAPADDNAAFYCPADDTIYVAARFASAIYHRRDPRVPGRVGGAAARSATSASPTCSRTSTRTTSRRSSASSRSAAATAPSRSSSRPTAWPASGRPPPSRRAA